jgi:predicted AlkP superfamily phosphohydrolase/phosphomutase
MGHVGQIYLNVAGREPEGIVTPEDYEETREQVIAALRELRDRNGRSLISQIIVREETYQGPYSKFGPDIHVVIDDYNMIAFPMFATNNRVITDQIRGDSGCHRREGIFIAQGPAVRQGEVLPEANILDLAPTILALLGESIPTEMDGSVLQEAFSVPLEVTYAKHEGAAAELQQSSNLEAEEEEQIEERLRGLGYL